MGMTAIRLPEKADCPTMYFIGVTTAGSSIMKLFPLWAEALDLNGAVLKGVDIQPNAEPEVYRNIVEFIKNDPLSQGALVTTHKVNVYQTSADLFEYLDPYAKLFGELSSISKKDGRLEGYAKDAVSAGLALEAFMPGGFFRDNGGEVMIMGSGGSAIAICSYLLNRGRGADVPTRVIITARRQIKLDEIKSIIGRINPDANVEYHVVSNAEESDILLNGMKPYSLVVNATGMGKDRPGSPLTECCVFPEKSLAWELNYRGKLDFMRQALAQKEARGICVEDGWAYFIYGWTQVIGEVFHIEMTDDIVNKCYKIANKFRSIHAVI